MKQFVLSMIFALGFSTAFTSNSVWAADIRHEVKKDSLGRISHIYVLRDKEVNGKKMVDTLSITASGEKAAQQASDNQKRPNTSYARHDENREGLAVKIAGDLVPLTAVVMSLFLPVAIVAIVAYSKHKNRKARYQLMEKALSSGQPLPDSFFQALDGKPNKKDSLEANRTGGIKKTFFGVGFFAFMWALTGEFGVSCIGLLIMFTGLGQLVIYYTSPERKQEAQQQSDQTRQQSSLPNRQDIQ